MRLKIILYLCSMKTIKNTITVTLIIGTILYVIGANLSNFKGNVESKTSINLDSLITKADYDVNTTPSNNSLKEIHIVGLDNVSDADLNYASSVIENFYGYKVEIYENLDTPSDVYYPNSRTINADNYVNRYRHQVKTIYLTYDLVYQGDLRLRGYTYINGNTILVRADRSFMKETLIHEIGHTLGLDHCGDLTCIMAINNDEYDSGDFCSKCKSILRNN